FNSSTLKPIPATQIRLNFQNRRSRSSQAFAPATNPRNVHTSFQRKLLSIATSAAITLLKLRFQPNIVGEANNQTMPMSTTRPVPPTTQNRAYRLSSFILITRPLGQRLLDVK